MVLISSIKQLNLYNIKFMQNQQQREEQNSSRDTRPKQQPQSDRKEEHQQNKDELSILNGEATQMQSNQKQGQLFIEYQNPIDKSIEGLSIEKMQGITRMSKALSQQIRWSADENQEKGNQKMQQPISQSGLKQSTLNSKNSLHFSQALHLEVSVHKIFIDLQQTKVAVSYLQQLFLNQRETLVIQNQKLQEVVSDNAQRKPQSSLKKQQKRQIRNSEVLKSQIRAKTQLQEMSQDVEKYKKTLMLRQSQLGSLLVIIMKKKQPSFEKDYKSITDQFQNFMIPFDQTHLPINIVILDQVFQTEREYLKQYKQYVQSITKQFEQNKEKPSTKVLQKMKNKIKVLNAKIVTIAQIFPYACITPLNDLFSFKKTQARWQNLFKKDVIHHQIYASSDQLKQSFNTLRANLNIINASMNIYNKNRQLSILQVKDWGKIWQSASKVAKIALFKGQAHQEAQLMISQGDNKLAKQIWNLPDQKIIKDLVAASLPNIRYSEKMYIKRIFKQYLDDKGKIAIPKLVIDRVTSYGNQLFNMKKYEQRLMLRINSSHMIRRIYDQDKQKDKEAEGYMFNFNALTSVFRKMDNHVPEQLIYHIHGGGFISMSTFVHQTYIRSWANSLGVPIVSVQYGKAPEYPFPQGLYDCFQGYMWTLYCFRQVFHVNPKRVVLVGDSAGGNLVAALTTLLIQLKLQKPDGIVLVYPALNLNYQNYTPSLLTALEDMILPHTFLKVCLQEYLKDEMCRPKTDPHISPIVTPDQILKQYPPTRMFVGSMDPFHDDCCRFVERLEQLCPGKAKLTIFEQFPHGFLQFDMKAQPHQYSRKGTKQVQQALRELIKIPQ